MSNTVWPLIANTYPALQQVRAADSRTLMLRYAGDSFAPRLGPYRP